MSKEFNEEKMNYQLNFAKANLKGPNESFRNDEGFEKTKLRIETALKNLQNSPDNVNSVIDAYIQGAKINLIFKNTDVEDIAEIDEAAIEIAVAIGSYGLNYIAAERAIPLNQETANNEGLKSSELKVIFQPITEVDTAVNRILSMSIALGNSIAWGRRSIDQLIEYYKSLVNSLIVKKLIATACSSKQSEKDVNFILKEHNIEFIMDKISKEFDKEVTAWIVDDTMADVIIKDKDNFKANENYASRQDDCLGYYKAIPVVRTFFLNSKQDEDEPLNLSKCGLMIGVHRSTDGSEAPVTFGNLLPIYSALPAVNPLNNTDLQKALFANLGCTTLNPDCCILSKILT